MVDGSEDTRISGLTTINQLLDLGVLISHRELHSSNDPMRILLITSLSIALLRNNPRDASIRDKDLKVYSMKNANRKGALGPMNLILFFINPL